MAILSCILMDAPAWAVKLGSLSTGSGCSLCLFLRNQDIFVGATPARELLRQTQDAQGANTGHGSHVLLHVIFCICL